MRAKEFITEDQENFNGIDVSMEIQKDDEYVDDEDYDNQVLYVTASSKGKELGHVLFAFDGEYLMPQDLEVEERYRGQGIAQIMYDYVKSKGYKIRRSGQQTDAGAGFWNKHKGSGQNVWEQGVAENFLDEGLRVDVPNEEWLQDAIDYAKQKSPDRNGLPYMGKTTATVRSVDVPVDILKRIPGMRREQQNVRQADFAAIIKIMSDTGKLPLGSHTGEEYKPFINVAYDGSAWVNEGNHRIMAAAKLGWKTLPVEISYFDGGERVESGAMYPPKIGLVQVSENINKKSNEFFVESLSTERSHSAPDGVKQAIQKFATQPQQGVAEGSLNEGLAHPVIVVDVQPEYSGMNDGDESSVFPQIINFVNKQTGPVLMFVNAEDQGLSGDTIQDIKQYWDDTICPEEERYTHDEETDDYIENPNCPKINWQRFAIADKGYGYFRSWMDHGIEPATIVATIRELYQQKKSDSRELQFPAFNKRTPQQSLIMGAMQEMEDDPISVNWTSVSQLKRFNGAYIVGGARDQCLREVELLMNAFNIKYKRIDSLIYEGQQGVAENFADGKNPEDKGDSVRHGIPKHATMAELEKASHADGRKGQLARWQLNMRRGHKK